MRRAEQSAAWAVMRSDRRFLWFWAGVAAAASLAGNLGHAWVIRASTEPPLWMSYGWAVVPVILLMLSAYAKPTLKRMLTVGRGEGIGDDGQDRISSAVVWAVFFGAFIWSSFGIYGFTVTLGVPASVAWIAPATIDVALFGALRGLVLTAPIAARMKVGIADAVPAPASPQLAAASAPAPAPKPAPAPPQIVAAPALVPQDAAAPTPDAAALAARIVALRVVKQPPEVVAGILTARASGAWKQRIADDLGIHHSVVGKVLDAAAAESIPA
jgi:hypothetical protein